MAASKGMGSLRERRPGVWEVRVAAGSDPVTGRVIQRSVTFHGSAVEAEQYRVELAAEYAVRRVAARAAPMLTVGELLERWLASTTRGVRRPGMAIAPTPATSPPTASSHERGWCR